LSKTSWHASRQTVKPADSVVSTLTLKLTERLKRWARRLKTEVYALYLAYKDPRVSSYARVFAACVVGYAFSPIDLIPDPIPVLGYLDDLVLIPLGIALAIRMIPSGVLAECREKARTIAAEGKPVNRVAAVVVVAPCGSLWRAGRLARGVVVGFSPGLPFGSTSLVC
jgi:uncharacterized membrane protein YkvA (DUF1232 family)